MYKSKTISFTVSDELHDAIEAHALEIDGNISATVRKIVANYLRQIECFGINEPTMASSARNGLMKRLMAAGVDR